MFADFARGPVCCVCCFCSGNSGVAGRPVLITCSKLYGTAQQFVKKMMLYEQLWDLEALDLSRNLPSLPAGQERENSAGLLRATGRRRCAASHSSKHPEGV